MDGKNIQEAIDRGSVIYGVFYREPFPEIGRPDEWYDIYYINPITGEYGILNQTVYHTGTDMEGLLGAYSWILECNDQDGEDLNDFEDVTEVVDFDEAKKIAKEQYEDDMCQENQLFVIKEGK